MKKLLSCLAAALLAAFSACGGDVVVDGAATSTGSTSGTGGTGGSSSGTGAASCFNLPARASLTLCGGTGGSSSCSFIYNCFDPGGAWEADCTGSACTCLNSGMVLCECAFSGTENTCNGGTNCCFQ